MLRTFHYQCRPSRPNYVVNSLRSDSFSSSLWILFLFHNFSCTLSSYDNYVSPFSNMVFIDIPHLLAISYVLCSIIWCVAKPLWSPRNNIYNHQIQDFSINITSSHSAVYTINLGLFLVVDNVKVLTPTIIVTCQPLTSSS